MTVTELMRDCRDRLTPLLGSREAAAVADLLAEHLTGLDCISRLTRGDRQLEPETVESYRRAVNRLEAHEPIQYVTGTAWFHGLKLHVTPDVLVPRPETSELVDMIEGDYAGQRDLLGLDMCTGSGCIALSLVAALPFCRMNAVELSPKALDVARGNARLVRACGLIEWIHADVLAMPSPEKRIYDFVVSNPPYVLESEKPDILPGVLDYEPHMALFVPDDDPLRFYRAIGLYALQCTRHGGKLYLEINPSQVKPLVAMLKEQGWQDVGSETDMHGRARFVIAQCP